MYIYSVKCPYCGKDCDMGSVLCGDDNFDHECEHCGEEFEVQVEFSPTFSASKIEYLKCEICGKEDRSDFMYKQGKCIPYPKAYKYNDVNCVCPNCWRKGIVKELDGEK